MGDFNLETISIIFSGIALIVSFASLAYTIIRIRIIKRQLNTDVDSRIYAAHRDIMSLAFSDNQLFDILDDKPINSALKQKHYIQLWINLVDSIWYARQNGLIDMPTWYSFEKELYDFFSLALVREHWSSVKEFYRPDFVEFVAKYISCKSTDKV